MQKGQIVTVTDYEGKKLRRKVVDVIGEVVLICKEEEYEKAQKYRSLPWCVGFKKAMVSATHN
jgi:hypothetical protein